MSNNRKRRRIASDESLSPTSSVESNSDETRAPDLYVDRASFRERFLDCSICCNEFNKNERKPKTLNCGHVFCLSCLLKTYKNRSQNSNKNLECPTCRKESLLAKGNKKEIEELPNSYIILEIMDFMEETSANQNQENICSTHRFQIQNFFCQTCQIPVCGDCTVIDHKEDQKHRIVSISQELEQQNCISENIKARCTETLQNLEIRSEILNDVAEKLSQLEASLMKDISDKFTRYRDILRQREGELKKMVHEETREQILKITERCSNVKKHVTQFRNCQQDFLSSLNSSDIRKVMIMNRKIESLEEYFRKFADETDTMLLLSCQVSFKDKKMLDSMKNVGKIKSAPDLDLLKQL